MEKENGRMKKNDVKKKMGDKFFKKTLKKINTKKKKKIHI